MDFQAITWTLRAIQPLPLLPGDSTSMAIQINNRGQSGGDLRDL